MPQIISDERKLSELYFGIKRNADLKVRDDVKDVYLYNLMLAHLEQRGESDYGIVCLVPMSPQFINRIRISVEDKLVELTHVIFLTYHGKIYDFENNILGVDVMSYYTLLLNHNSKRNINIESSITTRTCDAAFEICDLILGGHVDDN